MKTVSSILAGFFILLLGGGFILGGTEFGDIFGPDRVTIAKIDGQKVPYFQFSRFRQYYKSQRKEDVDDKNFNYQVLQQLIQLHLTQQTLEKWGYNASQEELKDFYLEQFRDKNGKFDKDMLIQFRKYFGFGDNDFFLLLQQNKFNEIMGQFAVFSPDDIRFQTLADKTKYQIDYVYIQHSELRKRNEKRIKIVDADITKEWERLKTEEKNKNDKLAKENKPTKPFDEKALRKKAENNVRRLALDKMVAEEIKSLTEASKKQSSLRQVAAQSGFPVITSEPFIPGNSITSSGKKKSMAPGLHTNLAFIEMIRDKPIGQLAGPVTTGAGTYFFIVTRKEIPKLDAVALSKEIAIKKKQSEYQLKNILFYEIMEQIRNSKKIDRYDKKFFQD